MKEDFLHYIWQYQLFGVSDLETTNQNKIVVQDPGIKNTNSGPDFFNSKLRINKQLWAGNVEIHVNSSDWFIHGHETDANYDNVILHVVWEHDMPVFRKDNSEIPTLQLSTFVKQEVLSNYKNLFSTNRKWINCENQITNVDPFLLDNWLERLYFERLEQKSTFILDLLKESNNDWEAVLFKLLAKNFGLKVNGDSFFSIASNIEFNTFRKESYKLENLEALLFGTAGLLIEEKENIYYNDLKSKYEYLCKKYNLKKSNKLGVEFFRLRPSNFPTIRLSQLAHLYNKHQNLFSKLNDASSIEEFYSIFSICASSFWDMHYTFDSKSNKKSKNLSNQFIDLLLINTVIPLQFIYQKYLGNSNELKTLKLIRAIKPEKNNIIKKFDAIKIKSNSAFNTQALLQLKNNYCMKQHCLKCEAGNSLLRNKQ